MCIATQVLPGTYVDTPGRARLSREVPGREGPDGRALRTGQGELGLSVIT